MKAPLIFLLITACIAQAHSQFVHKIKADSVLITNDSCTAELNLENSTKHIKGFLYNKGNGRTEFRKAVKLNDSTFLFGDDTLMMRGAGHTFKNGLTNTSGTVKLGGALTEPTTITTSGDSILNITGTVIGNFIPNPPSLDTDPPIFNITGTIAGTSTSSAILAKIAKTGDGTALFVGSTPTNATSSAIIANGGIGTGVNANGGTYAVRSFTQSNGGIALYGQVQVNNNEVLPLKLSSSGLTGGNTVFPFMEFDRGSASAVGAGMGSGIRYRFQSYSNSGGFPTGTHITAETKVIATNLFGSNTDYKYEFWALGDSTMHNLLTLNGDGNIVFPQYAGSAFTVNDSTTYKPLVIDASGNIRKFNSWAASGSGSNAPRVSSISSSSTITPNALTDDVYAITALAENTTIAAPSGTFHDGQTIILRIKDNGISRTISWNAVYRGGMDFSLPTSTVAGKATYITFIWNAQDSKLDGVGLSKGY
jgi:hypothetical protein